MTNNKKLEVFVSGPVNQQQFTYIITFNKKMNLRGQNTIYDFVYPQVNPSEKIQSIYDLLVKAEEHIMSELKEGAKLSDVYKSGKE